MAQFQCQQCGAGFNEWFSKCRKCQSYGSIIEKSVRMLKPVIGEKPQSVKNIKASENERTTTGMPELNRILGGGIVKGSVILIGGDPGIGKSTILLQVSANLCNAGRKVLYVSAEESVYQTKLRAKRLNASAETLLLAAETCIDIIITYINEYKPDCVIIDSIQMVYKSDIGGTPGSINQVRECTMSLMLIAKQRGIALFLVGHITKEGTIAGPKTLEHMVDTVLYFEGDRFQSFRILRAVKNRFGACNEIAMYEMEASGLKEVSEPHFNNTEAIGKALYPAIIGTRPMIVEIQALTSTTEANYPIRKSNGIDNNRLNMIIMVLERRAGVRLINQDVYVNVVGGIEVCEPGADLAIAMALVSSAVEKPIKAGTAICGEIGLTGEVCNIPMVPTRVNEAARMGMNELISPVEAKHEVVKVVKAETVGKAIEILGLNT